MGSPINIGDRFKLTGRFLRSTGQMTGSAGLDTWDRTECLCGMCASGRFVASNERMSCDTCDSTGQVRAELVHATCNEPCPDCEGIMRHFNVANVYKVGSLDVRNVDVNPHYDRILK